MKVWELVPEVGTHTQMQGPDFGLQWKYELRSPPLEVPVLCSVNDITQYVHLLLLKNLSLRSKSCILNFCGFWKGKHATVQFSSQGRFTFLLFWVVLRLPHCSCPLVHSTPCSLDQRLPLQSSATARTFTCELVALSHPIRWKKLSSSEAGGIVGDFSQRPLASPL